MPGLPPAVRYALRTLLRQRFVTTLAVIAFALGIGVTTAVFTIFDGVLLQPLPFPGEHQLVRVYDTQPACATCPASYPKYRDWKERNQVFVSMAGATNASLVLSGAGEAERLNAVRATASLLDVFQVRPLQGRWFTEEEDRPGAGRVAVLSQDFWARRFASDPGVLGRTLVLGGNPHVVIGVLPDSFTLNQSARNPPAVYVPLAAPLDPATRGTHFLPVYARLRPGVSVEQATAQMRVLGTTLAAEFGNNHGVDVRSLREALVGNVRTPLRVLLGAVVLVLLIACANVANLLLAAGVARKGELAIRLALGASVRDVARQLAAEGVLLALGGAALALVLAKLVVSAFVALAAGQLPRAAAIGLDLRVVLFTALVALVVGVLCGLAPLLSLRTDALAASVREGDTRTTTGANRRFGNGLVVGEVALALALLVGGSLLVKNLVKLHDRDPGFRSARLAVFDVAPTGPAYDTPERRVAFWSALLPRLQALPGAESAAVISHLPMLRWGTNGEMSIEGGTPWAASDAPLVEYRWYAGDYFRALGIPLEKGRLLDDRDKLVPTNVLVSRSMAEKFWPGQDPVGKRFGQGDDRAKWWQVVGVVGDVRAAGLASAPLYEFYRTMDQASFEGTSSVVLRSRGVDPLDLVPGARAAVRAVDPDVPVTAVRAMDEVVSDSVGQPRLMAALIATFAGLAGLLALVGVYGVMIYNVRRQQREMGVRLALGADGPAIRRLVLSRGAVLTAWGVGLGLATGWLLGRAISSMLHDVPPGDPTVYLATAAAVVAGMVLACYPSARYASRVNPMVVLRAG
jgi:putative ABC transport system permease protein